MDVVLQRDRDAVQRPAQSPLRPLAVELIGFFQGAWVHAGHSVQAVLVLADARQVVRHQLTRGHAPLGQRLLEFRNPGLDDVQSHGLNALDRKACQREQSRQQQTLRAQHDFSS